MALRNFLAFSLFKLEFTFIIILQKKLLLILNVSKLQGLSSSVPLFPRTPDYAFLRLNSIHKPPIGAKIIPLVSILRGSLVRLLKRNS